VGDVLWAGLKPGPSVEKTKSLDGEGGLQPGLNDFFTGSDS